MLQRRSQHFSKRNRHVYAAERMQHTSVYNSSGVSFSRGRTAVSGYGACDVRAIGWSRVPVWVPSRGARPLYRGDAYAEVEIVRLDMLIRRLWNGVSPVRKGKVDATREGPRGRTRLECPGSRVGTPGANQKHATGPQETTRVLTSQIYKCATLHASSSGCPAVQHSVEILDGERTDQQGHPDPH